MDLEALAKNHYSTIDSEEYKQFEKKFKPKRTTDDCSIVSVDKKSSLSYS